MTTKNVLLHIGVEKTGTTSIQRALADKRQEFAAQGILYPQLFGNDNQMEIAVAAMEDERKDELRLAELGRQDCDIATYRDRLIARLREEVAASDFHTVVLSNEHCHSRLNRPDCVERLKWLIGEAIPNANVRVVVYVRRQDSLAVSLNSTRVRLGGKGPLFPPIGQPLPTYFAYGDLLDRYADVFGADALRVRVFQKDRLHGGDVVPDFFHTAGLGTPPESVEVLNESLSANQVRFLQRFNQDFPAVRDGALNPVRGPIAWIIRNAGQGAPYLPPRDEAMAFFNAFAEDNEKVRAQFFPELDKLFDDSFENHPDTADDAPLTEEQMFEFLKPIWKYARKDR